MVCPRDIYANDRTLAAGIRTSLALFAFGILVIKFDTKHNIIGAIFNGLGIFQLIYSQMFYFMQVKKLKNPDIVFTPSYINLQIIITIITVITMTTLYVILFI